MAAGGREGAPQEFVVVAGVELDSSLPHIGEMLIAPREVARATKWRIDVGDNISSSMFLLCSRRDPFHLEHLLLSQIDEKTSMK